MVTITETDPTLHNVVSDQDLNCLLKEWSIQILIKLKILPITSKIGNRLILQVMVCKSICLKWDIVKEKRIFANFRNLSTFNDVIELWTFQLL